MSTLPHPFAPSVLSAPSAPEWISRSGLALRDVIPAAQRAAWTGAGHCPGKDVYTLFRERVAEHPERIAVVADGTEVDYAALDAAVCVLVDRLRATGLGAHDVIALNLPNGWRAVAAELAVAALGGVALTYPVGTGRHDALSLARTSRAAAVLTEPDVRELLPSLPTAEPGALGPLIAPIPSTHPVRILCSSGSEAEPKMVAYSHDAMAGGRANYVEAMFSGCRPAHPQVLMLAQLASSYGSLGVLVLVRCGGTLILSAQRFDPETALRAIAAHRPTHVCAVPTMFARMARAPRVPGEDYSGLSTLVSSAAMLTREVLSASLDRFGVPFANIYGSSDGINCHTAWARVPDGEPGVARVGRPDPAVTSIIIVGEDDRPLPDGEPGQILARGPMSPLCYVGRPDLDARYRTHDGWVRSGDLGVLEPDGGLVVLDRIKRVVKRGGHTISPAQVEAHAAAHPAVAEAACIPLPEADLGEQLCLCVAPLPGAQPPSLAALREFLEQARGLSRHALPEVLAVFAALPTSATGKVSLKALSAAVEREHRGDAAPEPHAAGPHAAGPRVLDLQYARARSERADPRINRNQQGSSCADERLHDPHGRPTSAVFAGPAPA